MKETSPKSIFLIGRRWFSKSCGNTYNTVYIAIDGVKVCTLPKTYGYGEYYLQRAEDWLESNGYMPGREHYESTGVSEPAWRYYRDRGIHFEHTVIDVMRKKDL